MTFRHVSSQSGDVKEFSFLSRVNLLPDRAPYQGATANSERDQNNENKTLKLTLPRVLWPPLALAHDVLYW